MGDPYFPVKELPEKDAAQSISQVSGDEEEGDDSDIDDIDPMKTRQSAQPMMVLIRSLHEQAEKLQAIRDMGFGGFLHLDFPRYSPYFSTMLISQFESHGVYIKCDRKKALEITAKDVHCVYGIPYGGEKIVEPKVEDPLYKEMCNSFKKYHWGFIPILGAVLRINKS
uniref:Uncharacterized protein n=1 Tax=Chenopodium quinoa TaxID=63459 RepID=A0A803MUK5_CHEQI